MEVDYERNYLYFSLYQKGCPPKMKEDDVIAITANMFKKLLEVMDCEEFDVDVNSKEYGSIKRRYKLRSDAPPLKENIKDFNYKLVLWDNFTDTWNILNLKDIANVYLNGLEISADDLKTFFVGFRDNEEGTKSQNSRSFDALKEEIAKIKNNISNDYGKGI